MGFLDTIRENLSVPQDPAIAEGAAIHGMPQAAVTPPDDKRKRLMVGLLSRLPEALGVAISSDPGQALLGVVQSRRAALMDKMDRESRERLETKKMSQQSKEHAESLEVQKRGQDVTERMGEKDIAASEKRLERQIEAERENIKQKAGIDLDFLMAQSKQRFEELMYDRTGQVFLENIRHENQKAIVMMEQDAINKRQFAENQQQIMGDIVSNGIKLGTSLKDLDKGISIAHKLYTGKKLTPEEATSLQNAKTNGMSAEDIAEMRTKLISKIVEEGATGRNSLTGQPNPMPLDELERSVNNALQTFDAAIGLADTMPMTELASPEWKSKFQSYTDRVDSALKSGMTYDQLAAEIGGVQDESIRTQLKLYLDKVATGQIDIGLRPAATH